MMTVPTAPGLGPVGSPPRFDYSGLAPLEAAKLQGVAERLRPALQQTAAAMVAIGQELRHVRAVVGPRKFKPWLEAELGLSRSRAYRFIACADAADRTAAICTTPGQIARFPAGVLLELAAKSVPDDIIEAVLTGEIEASPSAVRAALAEYRGQPAARERHTCPSIAAQLQEMGPPQRLVTVLAALDSLQGRASETAGALCDAAIARYGAGAADNLRTFAKVLATAAALAEEVAA
jgi:hypothetical protein